MGKSNAIPSGLLYHNFNIIQLNKTRNSSNIILTPRAVGETKKPAGRVTL
jgi:hypothetical protein